MARPQLVSFVALAASSIAVSAEAQTRTALLPQARASLDCGYRPPVEWLAEMRDAVARGEVPDPRTRSIPPIPPAAPRPSGGGPPIVGTDDFFAYPDSSGLLLTDFTDVDLIYLMIDAANALLAAHGDSFDFVGFWVNFTPHHTLGAAFYKPVENDALGIGDPSTVGTPVFEWREEIGLGGETIQGFLMMWDIRSSHWSPGAGSGADFTRLAIAHELEHRWALFLPDLPGRIELQGNDDGCGRTFHWNWRVDCQGSAMELSEWIDLRQLSGTSGSLQWTASRGQWQAQSFVSFNTDTGGVYSYTDLYLMGFVTPEEMDLGNSELRYVHERGCAPTHFGPVSNFSSADIIASAGPRVPDASASQRDFRTGWIIIHLPGSPPTNAQRTKAAGILNQQTADWNAGTLGRGTMDNTLP